METILLFDEYRLIERSESEINGAWKGAHLLLFFLAFVFGSICTFCFHMLVYLFDENCVLFPKLLSLTEQRHSIIYDFIPDEKAAEAMPVDFVSTQWVESSVCYMPMYVPLLSGICGLIWTAMVLMCSSANQTLTGLHRSWRILPPIFIFSLAMGGLCIYSSVVTHAGLMELCLKLSEITGSNTCTYTINVATLAYERRIRGVYQGIRMTILSAWLHTCCWLLAAVIVLLRMLLVVDFRLVHVRAELQGDIDKILERHERHIRTVSPELRIKEESTNTRNVALVPSSDSIKIYFKNETFDVPYSSARKDDDHAMLKSLSDSAIQHLTLPKPTRYSGLSLMPDELYKLGKLAAYKLAPKDTRFIVKIIYDLLDAIFDTNPDDLKLVSRETSSSSSIGSSESDEFVIQRHFGQQKMSTQLSSQETLALNEGAAEPLDVDIKQELLAKLNQSLDKSVALASSTPTTTRPHSSNTSVIQPYTSTLNITKKMKQTSEHSRRKNVFKQKSNRRKSSLKNQRTQTDADREKRTSPQKVQIADSQTRVMNLGESDVTLKPTEDDAEGSEMRNIQDDDVADQTIKNDKDTQTQMKEKQD